MPQSSFSHARISGIVTTVGPIRKYIDDEIEAYGGDRRQLERIKKNIGLHQRHVVDEQTTAADLCQQAAQELLSGCALEPAAIDGLIFVTQTPDHFQPANAALLHGRLGLGKHAAAFDVNLGCSGWVYGLWLAYMMIEAGGCAKVLLLAGDTLSRCVNPGDRSVASLFGDAGSATLVEKTAVEQRSWFSLHTDGRGSDYVKVPAGAFRRRPDAETRLAVTDEEGNTRCPEDLYMDGAEVFNFSIKEEPPAIREILASSDHSIEDVDYVVFHQANKYIISNIARRLKLPLAKAPCDTVEKYGNQSCASIPGTICDALASDLEQKPLTVIMSGFGVGLSWASCLTRLDRLQTCSVSVYRADE